MLYGAQAHDEVVRCSDYAGLVGGMCVLSDVYNVIIIHEDILRMTDMHIMFPGNRWIFCILYELAWKIVYCYAILCISIWKVSVRLLSQQARLWCERYTPAVVEQTRRERYATIQLDFWHDIYL